MGTFKALLKLELLTKSAQRSKSKNVAVTIFKVICYVLFLALITFVLSVLSNSLISTFSQAGMTNEIFIFYILFIQILIIIFSIGKVIKTLYNQMDYNKLLHMPVKPSILFMSKALYLFINNFIVSLVLVLPFLICFGTKTGQHAFYYIMLLPSCLFIALIPFVVSMLLSLPFSKLMIKLKNKFLFTLILYILALAVGFIIYYFLLMSLLKLFNASNVSSLLGVKTTNTLKTIANMLFLQKLFQYLMYGSVVKVIQAFLILFSLLFVSCFVLVMFAKKRYAFVVRNLIERQVDCFKKEYPIKERTPKKAFFVKELITIFRSQNYSFQYLTIAVTTPLMVFFSNLIVSSVGVAQIGKEILPGISVLVLIMFLAMATSFSASTLTREGDKFIYTKLFPVKYSDQIKTKFFVYLLVAIPSTLISSLLLFLGGFLSVMDTLIIFIGVSMVQVGNVALSINMDIKSPKFSFVGDSEMVDSNSNMSKSLTASFVIAFILGISTIIISYVCKVYVRYLTIIGFAIPYMIYHLFFLFHKLDDRYNKIEV